MIILGPLELVAIKEIIVCDTTQSLLCLYSCNIIAYDKGIPIRPAEETY